MYKGLLGRTVRDIRWRFRQRKIFSSRKDLLVTDDQVTCTEVVIRPRVAVNSLTLMGIRMQKFHKHRDENPNMGFVLVEESSPMLDSSRPCKSLVKLAHIIDRDRRVTEMEPSSAAPKHVLFNSSTISLKEADKSRRCYSTTSDTFKGFNNKEVKWKTAVERIRNVSLYGDLVTQTRLMESLLLNIEGSKETKINKTEAYLNCTWNNYNINLVNLPLEDEYSLSRTLRVIDGAILVLCAVSSVYHNDVDMHMRKNGVARVIFLENMEKTGADPWRVIMEVRTKLKLRCASLQVPIGFGPKLRGFIDIVDSKAYYFHKFGSFEVPEQLKSLVSGKKRELIKLLSKVDHRVMVDSPSDFQESIRRATVARQFVPAFLGVASNYKSLLNDMLKLLPCPLEVNLTAIDHKKYGKRVILHGNPDGSLVGLVFSSEDCLEKQYSTTFAYLRIFEGTIKKGSLIRNVNTEEEFAINVLFRVSSDGLKEVEYALAGDIVATSGVNFEPGDTFTDGKVDYSIPCYRGLSLRPIEVGVFHEMFSLILESRNSIRTAESLHCASIKTGLEMAMRHNLVTAYCKNRQLESVREVLQFTSDFNKKLLNALIHGFAESVPMYSVVCFRKHLHVGEPTCVTYRGLIKAYRRVYMTAGKRLGLPAKIVRSMELDKILVERRHKVALVDMILGGGLVDAAYKRMKEDQLILDEKLITSFLHAYTAENDYTLPIEENPEKREKSYEEKLDKCQPFVDEMEAKGFKYTINQSLRERLVAAGIRLGSNVSSEGGGTSRSVCGGETNEIDEDC